MEYKIINKYVNKRRNYIEFELDGYVKFSDGKQKKIYCVDEYPFGDCQIGEKIEINLSAVKKIISNTLVNNKQGIISKSYASARNPHIEYEERESSSQANTRGKLVQDSVTLSAYEAETTYEFLYGSLEWLELYIEKANYYSDWKQKKQLPKTITRSDISHFDSKEIKGHFSTSLTGLRVISNDKPQFILEKLQTDFFSWLDRSGINADNCPIELAESLTDFYSILIGKGGEFAKRRRKEVNENIAKMTPEEREKNFYEAIVAYQEPLENEGVRLEAMKGQTYKDVKTENKFSGDAERGQIIFTQIKSMLENRPELIKNWKWDNDHRDLLVNKDRSEVVYEQDQTGEANRDLSEQEKDLTDKLVNERQQELKTKNSQHGELYAIGGGSFAVLIGVAGAWLFKRSRR